jgi:hypothetical protein
VQANYYLPLPQLAVCIAQTWILETPLRVGVYGLDWILSA